jgi:NADH-quinone oxidoreductase subunit C
MTDEQAKQTEEPGADAGADAGAEAGAEVTQEQEPELLGWPLTDSHGQAVVHCTVDGYLELMRGLKAEGFEMCVDVCGVDYLNHAGRGLPSRIPAERFEVVVNLLSFSQKRRVRVRVQVPAANPSVPTLFELWPGSEAMEREAFDMVGISFDGHPDLTRILMPEDWEGHPLRKDYGVGRIPVQFKAASRPGVTQESL